MDISGFELETQRFHTMTGDKGFRMTACICLVQAAPGLDMCKGIFPHPLMRLYLKILSCHVCICHVK